MPLTWNSICRRLIPSNMRVPAFSICWKSQVMGFILGTLICSFIVLKVRIWQRSTICYYSFSQVLRVVISSQMNLCSSFKSTVAERIHPLWLYEIQASVSSTVVRHGPSATAVSWGSLPQSLHKQLATWQLAFFLASRSASLSIIHWGSYLVQTHSR